VSLTPDIHVHRLRAAIASMAASVDGLDALVFTGGVGENAPVIGARAVEGLAFLGLSLNPTKNEDSSIGHLIRGEGAQLRTLVIRAREDLEIAREVRSLF